MRDLVRHRRHDAGLPIVPADRADAGRLAQPGAAAVGRHQQPRAQRLARGLDRQRAAAGPKAGDRRAGARRTPAAAQAASSAARRSSCEHHMGEGLARLRLAREIEVDRARRVVRSRNR